MSLHIFKWALDTMFLEAEKIYETYSLVEKKPKRQTCKPWNTLMIIAVLVSQQIN